MMAHVTANRHAKPPVADRQHFEGVEEAKDDVRHELADDQFPRTNGRDDELLNGATLALAHHRGGGQDGGNGKQDHADHTGNHEVALIRSGLYQTVVCT